MYTAHALLAAREVTEIVPARSEAAATLAKQKNTVRNAISRSAHMIGGALLVIRDQRRCHAAGYDRFPLYCEQTWGFKKSRVYQFIEFHNRIRELSTNVEVGGPLSRTEAQTRPLLQMKDAGGRDTVWMDVLNRHREDATNDHVLGAVDHYLAIAVDPARRDRPRDEMNREYLEENAIAKAGRRVPARPLHETRPLPSDDRIPYCDLGVIKRFISDVHATRGRLLAEIAKKERQRLNDPIGAIRLLADALESEMDTVGGGEPNQRGKESGRDDND